MTRNITFLFILILGYILSIQSLLAQKNNKKGITKGKSGDAQVIRQEEKQSIDNLYIDACTKLAQGLIQDALIEFKNIIKLDAKHHQSYFKLSEIYLDLKSYQEAAQAINNAIQINPKNKWYYLHQSKIYKLLGELNKSIQSLEELYKIDPKDSEAIYDLIDLYIRKEEWNSALKAIDYLKPITGTQFNSLRYKKEILIRTNRFQEAERILAEIVALNPLDIQSIIELADLYIRNEKIDQSIKLLENTNSSIKKDYSIIIKLIECYSKLSKKEKIQALESDLFTNLDIHPDYKIQYIYSSKLLNDLKISTYKKYIDNKSIFSKKNYRVLVLLGDLFQEENKIDSSLYYYKEALKIEDNNVNLWLLVVNNNVSNNNYQAAYELCTQALEIFPNNEQLRYQSGIIAYQLQKYDATVENLNKALILMSEASSNRAQLYTLLGDAYFNLNQYKASDQSFQKAIQLEPSNATAYNNYAYYLSLRNEKLDSALYYVTKALELKPDDPNYLDTFGWVYYQKGDYLSAVKWLEKSFSLQKSAETAEHLGDAHYRAGNPDKAKEFWQESIRLGNISNKITIKIQNGKL